MLTIRETAAGDLEGVESFLTAVVPVALQVGGVVGAAVIQSDALKYAARQAKSTTVQTTLADLAARTKEVEALVEIERLKARRDESAIGTGGTVLLVGLGLWLFFGR